MEDNKRILDKLDKLDERLDRVDITLAKQEINLAEHMKRSDLLEQRIEQVREETLPARNQANFINIASKVIAFCATVAGLIFGAVEFFIKFIK